MAKWKLTAVDASLLLYDVRRLGLHLCLVLLSLFFYSLFPLITQVYIHYIYHASLQELVLFTLLCTGMLLLKIGLDIQIAFFEEKFFRKVEKNIKEKYVLKNNSLTSFHSKFGKHLGLYKLYVRTIYYTIQSLFKIIVLLLLIWFFFPLLVPYVLFLVPIFLIFFGIMKGLLSSTFIRKKDPPTSMGAINYNFEFSFSRRKHFIPFEVVLKSFVSFYRIFFLAYFGYVFIYFNATMSNLIIGLLYLTFLIHPCIAIIKNLPLFDVTRKSVREIHELCK